MADIDKSLHVLPHEKGGWQVKNEGNEKATKLFDTQAEAIDFAKESARRTGGEVVVHRPNGKVRERSSHEVNKKATTAAEKSKSNDKDAKSKTATKDKAAAKKAEKEKAKKEKEAAKKAKKDAKKK